MKRLTTYAMAGLLFLGGAAAAIAQQPSPQQGGTPQTAAKSSTHGHDHDSHHAQHMEMCRQMMS
jgi:hypothetical protein